MTFKNIFSALTFMYLEEEFAPDKKQGLNDYFKERDKITIKLFSRFS